LKSVRILLGEAGWRNPHLSARDYRLTDLAGVVAKDVVA
jgi:hypothetical protein